MARLGIKFPDTDSLPIEDVLDCARAADRAGFESLWMSDYKSGDVFAVLSACAVVTQRIRLATGVAVIFNRAPTTLAMAAASLDTISKGRVILGLGQGHQAIVEKENGGRYDRPIRRLLEYTEIIRELLQHGEVHYRGEIFALDYKPWITFYRGRIPIFYPPFVRASAERAGRIADGTLLTLVTPDRARTLAGWIAQGAAQAGRDPKEIDVGAYLWTVVTHDAESRRAARRLIKRQIAWYIGSLALYANLVRESGFAEDVDRVAPLWQSGDQEKAVDAVSDPLTDAVALIGDLDECRAKIETYRAAGIQHPVIYPLPMTPTDTKRAFLAAVELMQ